MTSNLNLLVYLYALARAAGCVTYYYAAQRPEEIHVGKYGNYGPDCAGCTTKDCTVTAQRRIGVEISTACAG